MENKALESPFVRDPIGKLLMRFAIPSIISMVVNSIYNMVDQIFIGQGVGYIGNTATNTCFPFTTMYLALSLLIADGTVALFSLKLGENKPDAARRAVGTALLFSLMIGTTYTLVCEMALTPLLNLFGSSPAALPYAQEYAGIILIGVPFVAVSMVGSNIIRADGNPQYSMFCMLAGCITNIILDWHFVMNLGWGIAGAAWATVIGQVLNFILAVCYLPFLKQIKLSRHDLRLDFSIIPSSCKLGLSSFITQAAATAAVIIMNNSLSLCGAMTEFGPDIPMAAFGNAMKVNQVIVAVLLGISIGSQPILGFNYGAQIYSRVRKTYLTAIGVATAVSTVGCLICQIFTQQIVNIFGQESPLYNDFALICFHTFLSVVFLYGVTIPTGIFFQAIGKPGRAMLCSLGRQVLFFIPAIFITRSVAGLEGLMFAGPIADVCAFVLAGTLGLLEARRLKQQAAGKEFLNG